jgi:transcriptional antiterminator NusG
MNEELEGTTETTSQEENEEMEMAVDALENEAEQEELEETIPDAEEPADEAGETPVPRDPEMDRITSAFALDKDTSTSEDEALQAKAMEAFGLGKAKKVEEDLELQEAEAEEEEEEVEEEEEIFIPDDGRAWYVVHCYSGYENKVRHSIEQRIETMDMQDKIFDVVVPTEEEIEIKDGKRRTVERRVFPGYILVQMLMSEDSWYVVRNTPGVTGFVGMGNEPTPLRPDEVAKIMNRMEAEAPKVKFDFQIGEKVRIGTGPFADFIGTVAEIDADRAKVRVMVSFFGRETPVELDFLHVEKV